MKKKTLLKLLIFLLIINTFLSFFNLITNFLQEKDIQFNSALFDVFIEKEVF